MAQIKTGTVQVQNGSAVVTGVAVTGWDDILPGAIFAVVGLDQTYQVNTVDYASVPPRLTLAAPYAGATNVSPEGVAYCITNDFTPNFKIPLMARGDLETASIFSRAMQKLDAAMGFRLISSTATSATINAGTGVVTVTLANHGLISDQVVTVQGGSLASVRGTHIITVTGADTFTYVVTGISAGTVDTPPTVSYRAAISLGPTYTLPGHNFKVGTVLRYDASGVFVPAKSTGGEANGLSVGIVSSVSGSSFTLASSGPIYGLQGLPTNLLKGTVLYLGPDSVPVNLTATQPTLGAVIRSISSLTRSGSTATAVSTAHGFINGQQATIAGAAQAEYNGLFFITVVDANTFTYTVTGTPATPATGTVKASDPFSQLRIPMFVVSSNEAAEGAVFGHIINFPAGLVATMAGSTETVAGAGGAVPPPPASASKKYLSNRGEWEAPEAQAASVKFGTLIQTPTFTTPNWSDAGGEPSPNASVYGALKNLHSRILEVEIGRTVYKNAKFYLTPGAASFTVPSGVTKVRVWLWGAGSPGSIFLNGGTWASGTIYYGSGNSGSFICAEMTVSPGLQIPVQVGSAVAADSLSLAALAASKFGISNELSAGGAFSHSGIYAIYDQYRGVGQYVVAGGIPTADWFASNGVSGTYRQYAIDGGQISVAGVVTAFSQSIPNTVAYNAYAFRALFTEYGSNFLLDGFGYGGAAPQKGVAQNTGIPVTPQSQREGAVIVEW